MKSAITDNESKVETLIKSSKRHSVDIKTNTLAIEGTRSIQKKTVANHLKLSVAVNNKGVIWDKNISLLDSSLRNTQKAVIAGSEGLSQKDRNKVLAFLAKIYSSEEEELEALSPAFI